MIKSPRNRSFVFCGQARHVRAHTGAGHYHRDRPHRTCLGAQAVPNTLVSIHDDGFPSYHRQHVALRTNRCARSTTNARIRIDMRMLSFRALREKLAFFSSFSCLCLSLLQTLRYTTTKKKVMMPPIANVINESMPVNQPSAARSIQETIAIQCESLPTLQRHS